MAISPMTAVDPMAGLVGARPRWRRKCHAHNRAGRRCGEWALAFQLVCHLHGGKSPQALSAARDRQSLLLCYMFGITPELIDRLQWIALHGEDRDVIAAFKLLMDVLVPVGSYVDRSRYAVTEDEIAVGDDFEINELADLPDVVA